MKQNRLCRTMDKSKKIESLAIFSLMSGLIEEESCLSQAKLAWETPKVTMMKISKLTAGFGPRFRDFNLPRLGAGS